MHVHFMGIGGTAMGSVAIASQAMGHTVSGSDTALYQPMLGQLEQSNISWWQGFDSQKVLNANPDLVVIGNAISRGNEELEFVLANRLAYTSMAGFVGEHLIGSATSIVVTGTHGKTTTSSIVAWILEHSGLNPGFLIGGVLGNFSRGCRPIPKGSITPIFVAEGDEYDTALFDKRSKFMHYRPTTVVVNNIEFDHADIFPNLDAIVTQFHHLLRIVPNNGTVLFPSELPQLRVLLNSVYCNAQSVGTTVQLGIDSWVIRDVHSSADGVRWNLATPTGETHHVHFGMPGQHSARNASMAIAACVANGLTIEQCQQALALFIPPKRRLEHICTWKGAMVFDDFAHHPTAIQATIAALAQQYPDTLIHAVFEPRSNTTTRAFFQRELSECFDGCASVVIAPIHRPERYAEDDRLDTQLLQTTLRNRGIDAHVISTDVAAAWGSTALMLLEQKVKPNSIIVLLSNGNVGGLRELISAQ
jgi:UDP-N-acetylmuramate: L-alanyl-gamma-D-glutamyl-meso-diaminopimelate ligase